MIVRMNDEQLLRSIASNKHKEIYDGILDFINDVQREGGISQAIRKKYHTKKMSGTDEIFKFRVAQKYRCLFKYAEENRLFLFETEIVLLKVTEHDRQGEEARRLDAMDNIEEGRIVSDTESQEQSVIEEPSYLRYIPIQEGIDTQTLMRKMFEEDNRFLYPLQGMQDDVLDAEGPLLLMGSAGSGKTLVEVSKALKNAHVSCQQLYITFTSLLKENAEHLYRRYSSMTGLEGRTNFYTTSQFLLHAAGLKDEQYFSFERFLQWMKDGNYNYRFNYLKDIDPVDLWTEIRGIIKGYTNDYFRFLSVKDLRKYIQQDEIQEWLTHNYVLKTKDDTYKHQIRDVESLYPILKDKAPSLFEQLKQKDLNAPFIDEYTYLYGMSEKYSIYDVATKRKLYAFVRDVYQPYLKEHNLYDDNDLARLIRQKRHTGDVKGYDHVFIDEVQDLSELQILAFLELAENPHNVYMTGDVSQIVNPTLFVKGRVGAIYRQRFANMILNTDYVLDQNFRNGQRIMDIVGSLLDIRQEHLGKYADDIREVSRAKMVNPGIPFCIDVSKEKFMPTIKNWLGVPNVAVIVSTIRAKKRLKSELGIPEDVETNIFTVQEVKGREFQKTILYNITTDFAEMWHEIMNGPQKREQSTLNKYKYYFNLFYVALTRAKFNVFLYEDEETPIVSSVKHLFEHLQQDINTIMDITSYDTVEKRRAQAEQYFEQGDYERAKTYYWQLDDTRSANIAQAYSYIQKGQYEQGVLMLYSYPEHHEHALEYTGTLPLLNRLLRHRVHGEVDAPEPGEDIIAQLEEFENEAVYRELLKDAIELLTKSHKKSITERINTLRKEG